MGQKIDFEGVFRGTILESKLGVTKQQKPQWVARLSAVEQWIDAPDKLTELGVTEPCWADVSAFGLEIEAFLMLFNSTEVFDEETAMTNYKQLRDVLSWDGTEFDTLNNGSAVGKKILFRTEVGKPYTDDKGVERDGSLRVQWIDQYDASPVRTLRGVDDDTLKSLNSKLKVGKAVAKPVAAKPVVAKPGVTPAKPAVTPAKPAAAAPVQSPAESLGLPAVTPAVPPKPSRTAKKPETPAAPAITPMTEDAAWTYVCQNSNGHLAATIQNVWETVGNAIVGERDPATLTDQDWGAIAHAVVTELKLAKV